MVYQKLVLEKEDIQLRDKIIEWLVDDGYDPQPTEDKTGYYDYYLTCPVLPIVISIGKPKNSKSIAFGTGWRAPEELKKQFKSLLSKEARKNFKIDFAKDCLYMQLTMNADPPEIDKEIGEITITDKIYYEGLDRDRFIRRMFNVWRGYVALVLSFERVIPDFHPIDDSTLK